MKHPSQCSLCGGLVVLTTNDKIYGKSYGNGMSFLCKECGAYVGTHNTGEALGRLANKEMRTMKMACHNLFDGFWKSKEYTRTEMYRWLASQLGIKESHCHFGWFDLEMLNKAYAILKDKKNDGCMLG